MFEDYIIDKDEDCMKRRIWSLLLALSLAISAFSACGGKDTNESVLESAESTESASETHVCAPVDGSWKHNTSVHWQLCSCGEKLNSERHFGGDASCTEKPACEVCGKVYGKVSGHTFSELKALETGAQGYECTYCGEKMPLLSVEHEDGTTEEGLLDFVVDVEVGRNPVILQLSDTQLTNRDGAESRCYSYVRETVAATNPDLILITGDLVYGRFDQDGSIFKSFIAFMESLKKPWAPVFGNHDNECWLGVDWQCGELEKAEYCLFKQGEVTGNGNYSVGIMQGGNLLRVFYMMDSNGCTNPRIFGDGNSYVTNTEKTPGKNVVKTDAGFGDSQIGWYTSSIQNVTSVSPTTKTSMAFHIQMAYFDKAYAPYGYRSNTKESSTLLYPINFDAKVMLNVETWKVERTLDVKEGDIGYLGRAMKGPWDSNYTTFNSMKDLGIDSIFVGHEHCNSASVVYNGVRFQYGQKSSTYDRYNYLDSEGHIIGGYSSAGTPLIGGTAFSLSQEDGTIINPYIYLAGDPLKTNPKVM